MITDAFDLQRFVTAQEPVMARVLAELRAGAKRSHWMWFVFPQIAGLGSSATAPVHRDARASLTSNRGVYLVCIDRDSCICSERCMQRCTCGEVLVVSRG